MKSHPLLSPIGSLFAILVVLGPAGLRADTTDDFEGNGTPATVTQLNPNAPPPSIISDGGPNGNFLRLLSGANGQDNHYTYELTDPGAFETINATFDFRITAGNAGLADGFHFLLVPTSGFGTFGNGPNVLAEEPNAAGTFAIAIDVYPGINNVSAHYDGLQVNEVPVPTTEPDGVNFRGNGVFNRVVLAIERVGNGSNMSLSFTDEIGNVLYRAMETVLPNMLPYENRVQFGGRTGGENMNLDIDNLNVTYADPFNAVLEAAPAGHLIQDFDRTGTTMYAGAQPTAPDALFFRPGPLIKPADAGSTGAFLRIAADAVNGINNHIAFSRAVDAGVSNATDTVQLDVRFNSSDGPADGLGMLFLPTLSAGTAGAGIASSEEPNHPGVLAVGLDIYANDAADPAPGISVHWDGVKIVDNPVDPSFGLGQFHQLQIIRETVPNGLNVSVVGTPNVNLGGGVPVTLLDKVFVEGARLYDYRLELSARTGGLDADHDVDNISATQTLLAPTAHTETDFSIGNGAGYKGYRLGLGAAPDVMNEFGVNGDFLRLTHDNNNSQLNSINFDQQLDGLAESAPGIVASFDFRIASPTDAPADGFAFMLLPTAVFGTSGLGAAATPGFVAEEPNVGGVFALAFDIYNGGPPFNEVSLHWNGSVVAAQEVDPTLIDFDANVFHNARLELRQDGDFVFADLALTADTYNFPAPPVLVFDDILLNDMQLYDYRVEFAGRTGGLNMAIDLDTISVATVPEPSTAALLLLGLGLAGFQRRRS